MLRATRKPAESWDGGTRSLSTCGPGDNPHTEKKKVDKELADGVKDCGKTNLSDTVWGCGRQTCSEEHLGMRREWGIYRRGAHLFAPAAQLA